VVDVPPVIIDASIDIRIIWALPGGKQALSVLHSQIGGSAPVNQAMANTIAQAVSDAHTSSGLAAVQPDSVSIESVAIRDLRTPNQPLIIGTTGLPSAGTIVDGDMLPKQDAINITKRTALAGKSFRGRMYTPGFDESVSMSGGEASTGGRDAAVAFLEDLNTDLTAEGWPLAVGSVKLGISTVITGFDSRVASFASQRRRRTAF
jgi:hypothetical protein